MAGGWLDTEFSLAGKKIWIAGHNGMVGAALSRRLQSENCEILTISRAQLDLRRQQDAEDWMRDQKPDVVVIAAATVGGILANDTRPAEFLYDNLMIEANIIHAAHVMGVEKLLFLGSSCIYPKEAAQPVGEDALLTGALEPTNEAYALAKIAGIKLCQSYRRQYGREYISAQPCNLYGPGDTFDARNSHVIPALMMKAHDAKISGAETMEAWGSGRPLREFLHADDLADGLVFLLKTYSGESPVNIGSGEEISIHDLARMIARVTGFTGRVVFNPARPDGTLRKLLDSSKIRAAGWRPQTGLEAGLAQAYAWYVGHKIHKKAA